MDKKERMEEDKINVLCNSCKIFPWRIQLWFLSILMRRRSENIIFKTWNELVSGDHKIVFHLSECNAEIVLFEKKCLFINYIFVFESCSMDPHIFCIPTSRDSNYYGVRIQRIRIQSIAIYISGWGDCLLLWWCCFLQHLRSPPPRLILNMVSAVIPMEVMVDTLGSAADSAEHNHPLQPKPAVLDDKML